jgi:sulfhydrogenase subunit beta (sulfur reductase)
MCEQISYHPDDNSMFIIQRKDFDFLIIALKQRGFDVIGPVVRDNAIVYDHVGQASDLPAGRTEERERALYRVKPRTDEALFGYTVGPVSWKRFLFPPRVKLFSVARKGKTLEIESDVSRDHPPRYAFIGVRSCDLCAIDIQERVFKNEQFSDPTYLTRQKNVFIVAVNCTQSAGTCFCVSMNAGPKVKGKFDLALTEVIATGIHYFVAEVGSDEGAEIMKEIPHRKAEASESAEAEKLVEIAAQNMGRTLKTEDLRELLFNNLESAHWDDVARRCLMCANCTMVCPTCFCSTVEDVTDLSGDHAERWRRWDSCFTMDFAKVTGGNFRASAKARYRQWMTHKLASWIDQFGISGCVGCGRCIAWCPVGIDITAEAQTLRNIGVRIDA